MRSLRIVSIGECTIDRYLDVGRDFVGGIALNFAVQSRRAGADAVSLVSCVGTDHGARILEKLRHEGVDASCVRIQEGSTARQDITVVANGERIFPTGGYHLGVLDGFRLEASDYAVIQQHDALACALFRQVEPLFAQTITQVAFDGARVADFLDLADFDGDIGMVERYLRWLTVAFISGSHALVEQLRPLSRRADRTIVVTLGAEGSVALVRGEPLYQPALPVAQKVDSTGCGDAFQAAFTVSYLRDGDVALALRHGAQQAAHVLQHLGAID